MYSRLVVFLIILVSIISRNTAIPLSSCETYELFRGMAPFEKIFSSGFHRHVYYHGRTIAVIDINQSCELHECIIAGGLEPGQIEGILNYWSKMVEISEVSLQEMINTLSRCEKLDEMESHPKETNNATLFFPGTKWCGVDNVANDYHDLGYKRDSDRCCRAHDLCPVSISSGKTAFNITNKGLYTISHCACEKALYDCLKSVATETADSIGEMYFNLGKFECIEEDEGEDVTCHRYKKKLSQTQLVYPVAWKSSGKDYMN